MNKDNIQQTIDWLEELSQHGLHSPMLGKLSFDMEGFYRPRECGTAVCIAGLICTQLYEGPDGIWLDSRADKVRAEDPEWEGLPSPAVVAGNWLGLSAEEAVLLFYGGDEAEPTIALEDIDIPWAIKTLERLLRYGAVHWGKARMELLGQGAGP